MALTSFLPWYLAQATPFTPFQPCARVVLYKIVSRQLSNYSCMFPAWPWENKWLTNYPVPVAQMKGHWAKGVAFMLNPL